jgi:MGT family glycosyltransferase
MYNKQLDVFRTVLEGMREEELNVVVTIGKQNDPAELGPQPANVQIHRFVPQNLVFPECTLAVIHGGAGSTMGALAFGLPLLLIPQGADQFFNTERVVAAGAGIGLLPGQFSARAVRESVHALIEDEAYRNAAQGIAREIATMPDPADAVVELERLLTRA